MMQLSKQNYMISQEVQCNVNCEKWCLFARYMFNLMLSKFRCKGISITRKISSRRSNTYIFKQRTYLDVKYLFLLRTNTLNLRFYLWYHITLSYIYYVWGCAYVKCRTYQLNLHPRFFCYNYYLQGRAVL